jgi:hypothetical protein
MGTVVDPASLPFKLICDQCLKPVVIHSAVCEYAENYTLHIECHGKVELLNRKNFSVGQKIYAWSDLTGNFAAVDSIVSEETATEASLLECAIKLTRLRAILAGKGERVARKPMAAWQLDHIIMTALARVTGHVEFGVVERELSSEASAKLFDERYQLWERAGTEIVAAAEKFKKP